MRRGQTPIITIILSHKAPAHKKDRLDITQTGIAIAPELCPQEGYHVVRNNTSLEVRIRKKSGLRPQLSGFHEKGFTSYTQRIPILTHRGMIWQIFPIFRKKMAVFQCSYRSKQQMTKRETKWCCYPRVDRKLDLTHHARIPDDPDRPFA